MDVNTMANISSNIALNGNYGTKNIGKTGSVDAAAAAAKAGEAKQASGLESEAYSVDISAAAKNHGDAVKGLTSEQIDVLKEGIAKSQELMIKTLTEQNAKLQGWLDEGIGTLNFDGIKIGADRFALPAVGTTPEEAAAAVAEGGNYSVDAVATRIFDLASAIAGNDPEKLKTMQAAVEEGFKQAGLTWKDATGKEDMPQITKDTHAEITKRFDDLYAKLTGAGKTEEDKADAAQL
jgi:hypothetical protein